MRYQPVVIIGAARSGTNILRDTLARIPGVGTWPCDEINYVWRHGHRDYPTDEFPEDAATQSVCRFIRRAFDRVATRGDFCHVVEKTCANSLRVGYVSRVLPDAKFVYIVRDGRDVVASATRRWRAALDLKYVLKKAQYVPLSDLPYYACRYLVNRGHRLFSPSRCLATWGPRFEGMQQALAGAPLEAVCALQWSRCVDLADSQLERIDSTRIYRLRYEQFVEQPADELRSIASFLDADVRSDDLSTLTSDVLEKNVGKWQNSIDEQLHAVISPAMSDTLRRHGYVSSSD